MNLLANCAFELSLSFLGFGSLSWPSWSGGSGSGLFFDPSGLVQVPNRAIRSGKWWKNRIEKETTPEIKHQMSRSDKKRTQKQLTWIQVNPFVPFRWPIMNQILLFKFSRKAENLCWCPRSGSILTSIRRPTLSDNGKKQHESSHRRESKYKGPHWSTRRTVCVWSGATRSANSSGLIYSSNRGGRLYCKLWRENEQNRAQPFVPRTLKEHKIYKMRGTWISFAI